MNDGQETEIPSDAVAILSLLRSMGVDDFEPRVVDQLTDFMYKYVTDVVLDAEAYSEHAGKAAGVVEMDDVMLSIQARTAYSFMQPTPQELLVEAAAKFNAKEMPQFPAQRPGLLLPDEKDCLTAPNYQLSTEAMAKAAAARPMPAVQPGPPHTTTVKPLQL